MFTAAPNSREYPCFSISGPSMLPIAEAEARAEPAMAPISMAEMMLIKASPPGMAPTRVLAKAISLRAIPPRFMSSPDNTKNGMASRAKLSRPAAIRCDTVVRAGRAGMLTSMVRVAEMAMLQATGVPMARRQTKLRIKTSRGAYSMVQRVRRSAVL